jgi:UDP-N-acetylmuramate--alanine ligase
MDLQKARSVYFLGIGGIGMSALARYFALQGVAIAGYDRTPTPLTSTLAREGMKIHFEEDLRSVPKGADLVIMTPAIPPEHKELRYFREHGIPVMKRSEVLGMICSRFRTIAVAGTHGKTTISTLIAHMLKSAGIPHIAFLGGISKNYGTNFLISKNAFNSDPWCVAEADEFDRSFLQLAPDIAVVTSADADHLDIYETHDQLLDSFAEFISRVRLGGTIILKKGTGVVPNNSDAKICSYSLNETADYHAEKMSIHEGAFHFDLVTPGGTEKGYLSGMPGSFNVENAVAAAAAGHAAGIPGELTRDAIKTYKGVQRRFDLQISRKDLIYIDDYAHHPEELKACITAVRELYPGKKVTGVFQPHLYSRTRDFADGFADALSLLDSLILLPIYPARERPICGVTSRLIYDKVSLNRKMMTGKAELINDLKQCKPEILLTLGAGDIDQLVKPIVKAFGKAT